MDEILEMDLVYTKDCKNANDAEMEDLDKFLFEDQTEHYVPEIKR